MARITTIAGIAVLEVSFRCASVMECKGSSPYFHRAFLVSLLLSEEFEAAAEVGVTDGAEESAVDPYSAGVSCCRGNSILLWFNEV